jgi:hypothetical protein
MLQLTHIALCGVATGLLIARGPKPLALGMGLVLGLSVLAIKYNHVAWHVLAPFACLAGIAHSCERRGFVTVTSLGIVAAIVVTLSDFSRITTGYLIAGAHAFAFGYGRHCFKSRIIMAKPDARRVGIVIASCAAGTVGALLWAHGLSTEPAHYFDIVLFVVLIGLSAW